MLNLLDQEVYLQLTAQLREEEMESQFAPHPIQHKLSDNDLDLLNSINTREYSGIIDTISFVTHQFDIVCQERKINSNRYKMLTIILFNTQNMEHWKYNLNAASELTFYRHFDAMVNIRFANALIPAVDGEVIYNASKVVRIQMKLYSWDYQLLPVPVPVPKTTTAEAILATALLTLQ